MLLGFAGGSTCRAAAAREVLVSPLRWTDSRGAPDQLPRMIATPARSIPPELKAAAGVHYVLFDFIIDVKGRVVGYQRYGTLPLLERVDATSDWKFEPARREGKPVNGAVTLAWIIPPAADAPGDAPPRLLDVSRVVIPRPRQAKPARAPEPRVVHAVVDVDATGAVTAVRDGPEEYLAAMRRATKAWRFEPARRGGEAVAGELNVPFVLTWDSGRLTKADTLPKPVLQVRPLYPFAMRASEMRGEVIVDFIVDIEGRVRNAFVLRTLNPAFDDFALDAVRKWRFEPGRVGARPVPVHMQVPIVFALDGVPDGGRDGIEVRRRLDVSKLPEELRYDTPPRITGMERVVYPYDLLAAGKTGRATVHYIIHESGVIAHAEVKEATDPEFGAALLAAVERFRYEPALKGGRAIKAVAAFSQEFTRDERQQVVTDEDLWLLARERKSPKAFATMRDLDTPLVPLSRKPPAFPLTDPERKTGEALIEVIIDEDGRARLPRAVAATTPAFAHAAIVAIATWRFEPPQRAGRATDVRVQIPIKFTR